MPLSVRAHADARACRRAVMALLNDLEDADRVTSTPDLAALEAAVLQALVDKDRSTLMALLDERFLITTAPARVPLHRLVSRR
jgi:hypothetical protein